MDNTPRGQGHRTLFSLGEQKIPTLNESLEGGLKVSALSGGENGLYLEGSICDILCLFLVDTGTNITLLRADLARKLKERLIYMAPNLTLKTATDLEKNEIQTGSEKIPLFSVSTQHHKRISDRTDVLSQRLCTEGCEPCSNAEKKFKMETNIPVGALAMTTEDRWSLSEIQKVQLEDPDIRPIQKMKLNSADRSSWQEIVRKSPTTKHYWALWNSLYLKDGVLYCKWESNDGGFYRRQLILPNCRIQ
ncbi:hypothetical protein AVEN_85342-1 [Araneus ventricosus]|uniref:Peptidase A2 domain-containing protein n=1 Tax=Araneus ventricosus TaxID=182803 RepID=A0A4Y2DXB6_ARAVE|nr:hypothetical protein AVEN_85342-1 [Araneus ventricosus]